MPESIKTIDISAGTILRVAVIVLSIVLVLVIWKILAAVFLAIVITAAIEPTVRWLERRGIHRFISVPSLYLLSLGALLGVFYAILPSLFNEIRTLSRELPQRYELFLQQSAGSDIFGGVGFLGPAIDQFFFGLQNQFASLAPDLLTFISTLFGGALSFGLVILISFYLSLQRGGVEKFLLSVTPASHKEYVGDFWRRAYKKMGRWLQAQFVLGVFMGIGVFIILTLLGIKYALTLAIIATILEVIPFIGPIIVGTLIFIAVSVQSVVMALIAVGVYIALQQIQQILVAPTIMARVLKLNPVVILISVLIGAELAGMWGILLAIPIAALLGEFFRDMQKSGN